MSLDLSAAQAAGFMAVEDVLIEFRDARLSILGYANGVVVNEKDGSPSPMVRMRTRYATDLAIETAAPLIEAQALRNWADDVEALYPADVFIPPGGEWLAEVHSFCEMRGHALDQISAHMMRHAAGLARATAADIAGGATR